MYCIQCPRFASDFEFCFEINLVIDIVTQILLTPILLVKKHGPSMPAYIRTHSNEKPSQIFNIIATILPYYQ